jgi:hypothetical protein
MSRKHKQALGSGFPGVPKKTLQKITRLVHYRLAGLGPFLFAAISSRRFCSTRLPPGSRIVPESQPENSKVRACSPMCVAMVEIENHWQACLSQTGVKF